VLLQELARRRRLVDVTLLDLDAPLRQVTPGVLAGGSGGLAVEDGLGHRTRLQRLILRSRLVAKNSRFT